MNFWRELVKKKSYLVYILFVTIILICGFTVISKSASKTYSRPVEVKEYTVSESEILDEASKDVVMVDSVKETFVIGKTVEPEEEPEEEKKEEIKKEDGKVSFKGVTVEVPKTVVASINDSEDKEKEKVDSSTSNGSTVTMEQMVELYENSGNSIGIDVSKWQGNINWSEVKKSGVDFAMIRIGYRGSEIGKIVMDPKFTANIKGATSNGIKARTIFLFNGYK